MKWDKQARVSEVAKLQTKHNQMQVRLQKLSYLESKRLVRLRAGQVVDLEAYQQAKSSSLTRLILNLRVTFSLFRLIKALLFGTTHTSSYLDSRNKVTVDELRAEYERAVRDAFNPRLTYEADEYSEDFRLLNTSFSIDDVFTEYSYNYELTDGIDPHAFKDGEDVVNSFDEGLRSAVRKASKEQGDPIRLQDAFHGQWWLKDNTAYEQAAAELKQQLFGSMPELVDLSDIHQQLDEELLHEWDQYAEKVEDFYSARSDSTLARHMKKVADGIQTDTALSNAVVGSLAQADRNGVAGLSRRTKGIRGVVRVSRTGAPCPFCAMLISRGPQYTTVKGAEKSPLTSDSRRTSEKYHDYCQCYAVVVTDWDTYLKDPRFEMNRRLHELWREKVARLPKSGRGKSQWDRFGSWKELMDYWDDEVDRIYDVKRKRAERAAFTAFASRAA